MTNSTLPLVPELSPLERDIGDSAEWSLSSAKLGNGLSELQNTSFEDFWQSDGLQPHVVTIEWPRLMRISSIQVGVYYRGDESYTPVTISVRIPFSICESNISSKYYSQCKLSELSSTVAADDNRIQTALSHPSFSNDSNLLDAVSTSYEHATRTTISNNNQLGAPTSLSSLPGVSPGVGDVFFELNRVKLTQPNGVVTIPFSQNTSVNEDNPPYTTFSTNRALGVTCGYINAFSISIAIIDNHQSGRDTRVRFLRVLGPVDQGGHGQVGIIEEDGGLRNMSASSVGFSQFLSVR